jgi:predicted SAM-dependent methyltransferase
MRLSRENAGLASQYLWAINAMPSGADPLWLHLGCGARVFEGFVNLDLCPQDLRVLKWNLLDLWPEDLQKRVEGIFSEDCFEHFFHGEQIYILCNINCVLRPTSVARILMPSLARLLESYNAAAAARFDELLNTPHGVETGADALNYGMRFTGHRWLHDQRSLSRMSTICGFDAIATDCAHSHVQKFNGLNLRDETNSASFANDLRKMRSISRTLAYPVKITGAKKVEDLTENAALFVATSERPVVEYSLPRRVASEAIACINFRSSNLSSSDWGLKTLIFDEINTDKPWYFDETLKSRACMNIITNGQLKAALGKREFSRLYLSPAASSGEYFTAGCAEMFLLE